MDSDIYQTITAVSEGCYSEKRSRFLSFAIPVKTSEAAKQYIAEYRKTYYNARHICWAYMLGAERNEYRSNDDGEPSSTAGRPILGQINSAELTDILLIVVRYFGGIELGTSRLTAAYRTAAADALSKAEIVERTVNKELDITFAYQYINDVMRAIKEEQAKTISQSFNTECEMKLCIRKSRYEPLIARLMKIESLLMVS
jgi:uncharacterized YigZ family protein